MALRLTVGGCGDWRGLLVYFRLGVARLISMPAIIDPLAARVKVDNLPILSKYRIFRTFSLSINEFLSLYLFSISLYLYLHIAHRILFIHYIYFTISYHLYLSVSISLSLYSSHRISVSFQLFLTI